MKKWNNNCDITRFSVVNVKHHRMHLQSEIYKNKKGWVVLCSYLASCTPVGEVLVHGTGLYLAVDERVGMDASQVILEYGQSWNETISFRINTLSNDQRRFLIKFCVNNIPYLINILLKNQTIKMECCGAGCFFSGSRFWIFPTRIPGRKMQDLDSQHRIYIYLTHKSVY